MTIPVTPPPSTVRALWPVTVVRQVVALGALLAGASLLPGIVERGGRTLVDQRTGAVLPPVPHLGAVVAVTAVVVAAVGVGAIALGLRLARRAVAGDPRAATGVGTLAALGVIGVVALVAVATTLELAPRTTYALDVPVWVVAVLGLLVVVDLVLVGLLVVPDSRRWFADRTPSRPDHPH